jgi:carotenoid cleavage dioxygenase-like enzyme
MRRTSALTRRQAIAWGGAAVAAVRWRKAFAGPLSEPIAVWSSESAFLSRAFSPVFDERDDNDLVVDGEIPKGLRGVFMRNGPNPQFQPDAHYAYPFDGTGMIHALYIENGKARYRNRWVLTQELAAERAAERRLYNSTFSPPPHADLANTHIVHHAGRYLALYEGGLPYEVTRDLKTIGLFDYEGQLPGRMSAHPKIDPVTGELLSLAYDLNSKTLTYLKADRSGRIDRKVSIPSPWAAMVHDVAITQDYLVAFICPLVFDGSHPGPPAAWQPDRGTMVAVIPRNAKAASEVLWISGAPFFQFHTVNAFSERDRIEVVVPWYETFSLTGPSKRLELHRLSIDIVKKTLTDVALDDRACEFGRVNDAYLGRKTRFGYVGMRDPRPGEKPQLGAFESIARYDLASGAKSVHRFPPGQTVCEPVFVADPSATGEESGFVFSFVHDEASDKGLFVILDARNVSAAPLATIKLPRRVPAGLHGSWIALST